MADRWSLLVDSWAVEFEYRSDLERRLAALPAGEPG